jgi:LPXTG-motif cell wall-anchored protein
MNRNGGREANEPFLPNTKVVASKPGSSSASALSNSSGLYEIQNVAPGTWTLTAELTATELERVYDTTGEVDWTATAAVPAGGVGQADFAAAGRSTISLSLLKTSAVVAKWAGTDESFCSADDISFTGTAKNGVLKLTGVPAGSYRVASEDPCDDGVAYLRTAVKQASVVNVAYAPELPATGSSRSSTGVLVGLALFALGVAFAALRRRII